MHETMRMGISCLMHVLLDFWLTVKAATLIFKSGRGSASAQIDQRLFYSQAKYLILLPRCCIRDSLKFDDHVLKKLNLT